jgi:hypothetical protein
VLEAARARGGKPNDFSGRSIGRVGWKSFGPWTGRVDAPQPISKVIRGYSLLKAAEPAQCRILEKSQSTKSKPSRRAILYYAYAVLFLGAGKNESVEAFHDHTNKRSAH